MERNYRGYQIEFDQEYGYIVKNGVRHLAEFNSNKDAEQHIDALIEENQ